MITHFQLKQNGCFQTFYRTPYFIKNMFLLLIQMAILLVIYLIYFRTDGGSIQSAIKILRGLNSDTFNYLETNKKKLNVNNAIPFFVDTWHAEKFEEMKKAMPLVSPELREVNTVKFFSQCVRFNKPCVVNLFALRFNAYKEWQTKGNDRAFDYMQDLIGRDKEVMVYEYPHDRVDKFKNKPLGEILHSSQYSFKADYQKNMTYAEFIQKLKTEEMPGQYVMKENRVVS